MKRVVIITLLMLLGTLMFRARPEVDHRRLTGSSGHAWAASKTGQRPSSSVRRRALIQKIRRQGLRPYDGKPLGPSESYQIRPLPVVSLEDFFTGNTDAYSIGCNLLPAPPGPARFYKVLKKVRSRADVQDVLVEIYEVDETDPTKWPFSDTVYILTSASREQVANWLAPLRPDEVGEGYHKGKAPKNLTTARGKRLLYVWWD